MNSDFFKDPVAIATLVLAFVTVFLAFGTFWSIRQNRVFREKDRKEQLLNEIIDWAIKVGANCCFETDPNEPNAKVTLEGRLSSEEAFDFIVKHRSGFEYGYNKVIWAAEYIINVSENIFVYSLPSISKLKKELEYHLSILHSTKINFDFKPLSWEYYPGLTELAQNIATHNNKLDEITKQFMKEAAYIKSQLLK
jgi:hypothetical protein